MMNRVDDFLNDLGLCVDGG